MTLRTCDSSCASTPRSAVPPSRSRMPARSSPLRAWTGAWLAWTSTSIARPPQAPTRARTPPGDASPPPGSGTCIPVRRPRRVSGQTFLDDPLARAPELLALCGRRACALLGDVRRSDHQHHEQSRRPVPAPGAIRYRYVPLPRVSMVPASRRPRRGPVKTNDPRLICRLTRCASGSRSGPSKSDRYDEPCSWVGVREQQDGGVLLVLDSADVRTPRPSPRAQRLGMP
jgi:hypothetical protein